MPGPKGTEVLKKMKTLYPELGVIMLTGFSTKDVAVDSLNARADDYVEKPVRMENLLVVIERVLKIKSGEDNINDYDIRGKIAHVKRFVEKNYHKRINLKDAASIVGLSPKYLSRIFCQEAGTGLSNYKSKIKIDKAKEWLSTAGYNVNQIADKLGYQNVESFIRAFKKHTKCTPSDYRRMVQGI